MNVHRFKRKVALPPLVIYGGTNGYVGFALKFALSDLPGSSDFTSLFDQYRIDLIKIYLVSRTNSVSIMEGLNNRVGTVQGIFCTDHDDSTGPTSDENGMNEMRERDKSRSFIFGQSQVYKHVLKPAIATEVFRTALTTAYAPRFSPKLDMSFADVPHFGFKGVVKIPITSGVVPAGLDLPIDVYATYYLTCYDVR